MAIREAKMAKETEEALEPEQVDELFEDLESFEN